jgi:hypothetical protein
MSEGIQLIQDGWKILKVGYTEKEDGAEVTYDLTASVNSEVKGPPVFVCAMWGPDAQLI